MRRVFNCPNRSQVSGGSSLKYHYYPALQRRWGNINGPYILQTDGSRRALALVVATQFLEVY